MTLSTNELIEAYTELKGKSLLQLPKPVHIPVYLQQQSGSDKTLQRCNNFFTQKLDDIKDTPDEREKIIKITRQIMSQVDNPDIRTSVWRIIDYFSNHTIEPPNVNKKLEEQYSIVIQQLQETTDQLMEMTGQFVEQSTALDTAREQLRTTKRDLMEGGFRTSAMKDQVQELKVEKEGLNDELLDARVRISQQNDQLVKLQQKMITQNDQMTLMSEELSAAKRILSCEQRRATELEEKYKNFVESTAEARERAAEQFSRSKDIEDGFVFKEEVYLQKLKQYEESRIKMREVITDLQEQLESVKQQNDQLVSVRDLNLEMKKELSHLSNEAKNRIKDRQEKSIITDPIKIQSLDLEKSQSQDTQGTNNAEQKGPPISSKQKSRHRQQISSQKSLEVAKSSVTVMNSVSQKLISANQQQNNEQIKLISGTNQKRLVISRRSSDAPTDEVFNASQLMESWHDVKPVSEEDETVDDDQSVTIMVSSKKIEQQLSNKKFVEAVTHYVQTEVMMHDQSTQAAEKVVCLMATCSVCAQQQDIEKLSEGLITVDELTVEDTELFIKQMEIKVTLQKIKDYIDEVKCLGQDIDIVDRRIISQMEKQYFNHQRAELILRMKKEKQKDIILLEVARRKQYLQLQQSIVEISKQTTRNTIDKNYTESLACSKPPYQGILSQSRQDSASGFINIQNTLQNVSLFGSVAQQSNIDVNARAIITEQIATYSFIESASLVPICDDPEDYVSSIDPDDDIVLQARDKISHVAVDMIASVTLTLPQVKLCDESYYKVQNVEIKELFVADELAEQLINLYVGRVINSYDRDPGLLQIHYKYLQQKFGISSLCQQNFVQQLANIINYRGRSWSVHVATEILMGSSSVQCWLTAFLWKYVPGALDTDRALKLINLVFADPDEVDRIVDAVKEPSAAVSKRVLLQVVLQFYKEERQQFTDDLRNYFELYAEDGIVGGAFVAQLMRDSLGIQVVAHENVGMDVDEAVERLENIVIVDQTEPRGAILAQITSLSEGVLQKLAIHEKKIAGKENLQKLITKLRQMVTRALSAVETKQHQLGYYWSLRIRMLAIRISCVIE